jgi:hypothetical protein
MHDSHSLGRLLSSVGFIDLVERQAHDSYIHNWQSFNLDTEPDGTVVRPDSVFVEGRKPL